MAKKNTKHKCGLFPVKREEILSIQEAQQQAGWTISAFNLPKAWKYTQGEGVKVAVLDTGCDLSHPDLVENLLPGKNFINPKQPPQDDSTNGHGTHVSGIICAANNEIGMVGVAPKAKLIPVKVLDKWGNGSLDVVAEGIRWAVEQGADFISLSLGSPAPLQQVRKAIQYAESKSVIVFCAAGNAGQTRDVFYPAAYPETISIGAIDESFHRAPFSCTGKNLDFMAPGSRVFSTVPKSWYAILSGTSMACPFAVGVAALVLSYKRKSNLNGNLPLKTSEDYRNIFKMNTIEITDQELKDKAFYQGFGIIDPRKLNAALESYLKAKKAR